MKRTAMILGLVLMIALLAAPAAAFTINRLDIAVTDAGDADMTADYSLSWVEQIVVLMRIAQPEQQLQNALEQYSGKEVLVTSVSPGRTVLSIKDFANVQKAGNVTAYTTPSLDFSGAEQAVKGYWFSRFVSVDASPEITGITFPDGYRETVQNSMFIPSITHTVAN